MRLTQVISYSAAGFMGRYSRMATKAAPCECPARPMRVLSTAPWSQECVSAFMRKMVSIVSVKRSRCHSHHKGSPTGSSV